MIMIGLGSNLTTEEYTSSKAILSAAIDFLEKNEISVVKCSRFYETEPVPKSDQPWFVNAVISVKTSLAADQLLKLLHKIEKNMGRVRRDRWEARIIDLDLLCYNDQVHPAPNKWRGVAAEVSSSDVIIPHARLHLRKFVLAPMADIDANWTHPVLKKDIDMMLKEREADGIVRVL